MGGGKTPTPRREGIEVGHGAAVAITDIEHCNCSKRIPVLEVPRILYRLNSLGLTIASHG